MIQLLRYLHLYAYLVNSSLRFSGYAPLSFPAIKALDLFQAFAFVAPWAYWHFRFGADVLGHLKFVQLLSDIIFKKITSTHEKKGFYSGKSFYSLKGKVGGGDHYETKVKSDDKPSCFARLRKTCRCWQSNKGNARGTNIYAIKPKLDIRDYFKKRFGRNQGVYQI